MKKFTNITLKWGITGDLIFWNWIVAGMNGLVQRAPGSVVLLDENRNEVMRWNFTRGWPCKWTGPSLNAYRQAQSGLARRQRAPGHPVPNRGVEPRRLGKQDHD